MTADYTFFACGSMGGGFALLLLAVLASWIVSGLLFLVNLCLLFALRDGPLLRNASGLLCTPPLGSPHIVTLARDPSQIPNSCCSPARSDCLQLSLVISSGSSAWSAANVALCAPSRNPRDVSKIPMAGH